MKKLYAKPRIFSAVITVVFMLTLLSLNANAGSATNEGLVPCGGFGQDPCGICHLFQLIQNINNYITLKLVPILGAVFFAIGGLMLLMSSGNQTWWETGKRILLYAFIGIVIVYVAWLAINSIIWFIVDPSAFPTPWNVITC